MQCAHILCKTWQVEAHAGRSTCRRQHYPNATRAPVGGVRRAPRTEIHQRLCSQRVYVCILWCGQLPSSSWLPQHSLQPSVNFALLRPAGKHMQQLEQRVGTHLLVRLCQCGHSLCVGALCCKPRIVALAYRRCSASKPAMRPQQAGYESSQSTWKAAGVIVMPSTRPPLPSSPSPLGHELCQSRLEHQEAVVGPARVQRCFRQTSRHGGVFLRCHKGRVTTQELLLLPPFGTCRCACCCCPEVQTVGSVSQHTRCWRGQGHTPLRHARLQG